MKRILIILTAIIVFLVPLMQIHQQTAHAATGKVISLAAKKIAKEVATDAAIETVGNLALKYAFTDTEGKYSVDPGKKLICLPGGKVNGECTKPAQLDTTRSKVTIGNAVEAELDKAINNGKHFSRWQKFLDWFAPLWLVSFGVTFLTYVFDSDVRTMFNEIAMNALYAIGAIQPVQTSQSQPAIRPLPEQVSEVYEDKPEENTYVRIQNHSSSNTYASFQNVNITNEELKHTLIQYRFTHPSSTTHRLSLNNWYFDIKVNPLRLELPSHNNTPVLIQTIEDGQITHEQTYTNTKTMTLSKNLTSYTTFQYVNWFMPYSENGKTHFDFQVGSHAEPIFRVELPYELTQLETVGTIWLNSSGHDSRSSTTTIKRVTNVSKIEAIPLPQIEEIAPTLDPLKMTPYTDGSIMVTPSPQTIPFTHSQTGQPLTRDEQDPNIWRDPAGEPVPEDLINVGDPEIIKQPDGSHVAIPQPTPSNPTPTPTQITEPKPEAPITPDDYEDLSCQTIKKPKFDPLATAVMTSFPFSIPWDIQRIYEAIFANVGSERPEFVFKIPGYDQEFNISLNPYFDDWVPFIRSIILITFDMGLLYAAYRWTRGGSE